MHASSSGNHALSSAYEPGYCKPRVGIRPSYDQVAVKWITHISFASTFEIKPKGWPEPSIPSGLDDRIAQLRADWADAPPDYVGYLGNHTATGDYLNMGRGDLCGPTELNVLDKNGVAMRLGEDKMPHYHPVLSAQCGLKAYGRLLRSIDVEESLSTVLLYADSLVSIQNEVGAFPYQFEYHYYLTDEYLPAGWVSGMAQGQALSLLARAYDLTQDKAYLDAGDLAVSFLATPVDQGGVMTDMSALGTGLEDFIFLRSMSPTRPTTR